MPFLIGVCEILVEDFGREDASGQHLRFRGEQGGEDFFGADEAAAVVAQVEDEFAHTLRLELLRHADQVLAGIQGETGEDQVAHLLAAAVEDLAQQDGILVHLHGFHRESFRAIFFLDGVVSQQTEFHLVPAEQFIVDEVDGPLGELGGAGRSPVHTLAVHLHDAVKTD